MRDWHAARLRPPMDDREMNDLISRNTLHEIGDRWSICDLVWKPSLDVVCDWPSKFVDFDTHSKFVGRLDGDRAEYVIRKTLRLDDLKRKWNRRIPEWPVMLAHKNFAGFPQFPR